MKLSKIYSSQPDIFAEVSFNSGVSVILAEIRLPSNKQKDTHNLGKTTLGRLLDFCLLSERDSNFFLFKHFDQFKQFVFFLEITLLDGSFLTIKRSVEQPTKISFKKHKLGQQNFTTLPEHLWDHLNVSFDRAKDILDGVLDLRGLKPWSFRKGLGYLLRSQDDYRAVFQLQRFQSGHADWKPYLAHILGFDGDLIDQHYAKEKKLDERHSTAQTIKTELRGSVEDLSKIEGMLLLKQKESDKKQRLLDAFDFRSQDKAKNKQLIDDIDESIAHLNSERYSLGQNRKKVHAALEEEQILFNPDEAKVLFAEAGVLFDGQIKKDFQQLIDFNKAITEERRAYLADESAEIDVRLKAINAELNALAKQRSESLSFLSGTDVFSKYKKVTDELVTLRADITSLERQRGFLHRLQELRTEIRDLTRDKAELQTRIEENVEKQNADESSFFSTVRLFFSEIVEEVIDRKALLSVSPNQLGHLEFKAEILDEAGNATSADMGHTYRKLLCVAFDMALLRAWLNAKFPRFVFHDGVFESLDDRKKENLLGVIRKYAEVGVQSVITLIDSDMPLRAKDAEPVFTKEETILLLHDEDQSGRLFRMRAW